MVYSTREDAESCERRDKVQDEVDLLAREIVDDTDEDWSREVYEDEEYDDIVGPDINDDEYGRHGCESLDEVKSFTVTEYLRVTRVITFKRREK